MSNGWRYEFTPRARRDLRRLDPPIRRRILAGLDRMLEDPANADIRRLQGKEEWRLRVGDWRVRSHGDPLTTSS